MASSPSHEHIAKGILLRLGMGAGFALMTALLKWASTQGVATYELVFYRNAFALPLTVAWVVLGPGLASVRTRRVRAHAARSAIGLWSMGMTFAAVVALPLAEMTAINFTAPLLATMLSAFMLRDKVGPHRWAAIAVGLAGMLIVVRPGSGEIAGLALAIGLAAALSNAVVTITIRQIGSTELPTTTVFWFNCVTVAVLLPGMAVAFVPHPPMIWGALALAGLSGGIAQVMMTASLRLAPVSAVAPFDYTQLVWAVLFAWLIWGDAPSIAVVVGAALIASGGIYVMWRERKLGRARG